MNGTVSHVSGDFGVFLGMAAFIAVWLILRPYLIRYYLEEDRVTACLFGIVPVIWARYSNIADVRIVPFWTRGLFVYQVANRFSGRVVEIRRKPTGLLGWSSFRLHPNLRITPRDPEAFVAGLQRRIAEVS